MQFDEKVLTALEVLTDAAENDFELFRICTLVRDLIAPPQVEIIDEKHQSFNGVNYRKDTNKHYKRNAGIHVDVWRYYHGDVPAGNEIHHCDFNPSHNRASNLQCLTKVEHRRIHMTTHNREVECLWCKKIFPVTDMTSHSKFCSAKCRQAYKYYVTDSIIKNCACCGKEFPSNKYDDTNCCSRRCAAQLRRAGREDRTCPMCGKTFNVEKSEKKVCCSRKCGRNWYEQKRKNSTAQPSPS